MFAAALLLHIAAVVAVIVYAFQKPDLAPQRIHRRR
jgi:hypothetical protein